MMKYYSILLGKNILDETVPFARVDDLSGCELNQLLSILLEKKTEILIRPQED